MARRRRSAPQPQDRLDVAMGTPVGGGPAFARPVRASNEVAERVAADARLRRLELSIGRKLKNPTAGDLAPGLINVGFEPDDARRYVPGDDPRRIDWLATARSGETQVRPAIGDHELQAYLLLDASASMRFGTGLVSKAEAAETAAAVFGFLAGTAGNHVGGMLVTAERFHWYTPVAGVRQVRRMLGEVAANPIPDGPIDFAAALRRTGQLARRRGLMVVISDFLDPGPWARPLAQLGFRHDLLCVVVTDLRERQLPELGPVRLSDPETGEVHTLEITPAAIERYRVETVQRNRARRDALARSRARVLVLDTRRDPMEYLIHWVQRDQIVTGP